MSVRIFVRLPVMLPTLFVSIDILMSTLLLMSNVQALVSCAGAVACGAFACYFGLARHVILLSLTMFALPLLQRFVHPYFWPYAAVVLGLTTALWLYEGMREMFVGVALFQAVPCLIALLLKMRALSTRPRLRLGVIAAVWLAAFVCIALPILSVALIALLRPEVLNEMIRYSGEPTKGAFINVGMRWQFVGAIETLMGMGGSGDVSSDPYRLLGVSMNANERDIQKRWRTLATEFHPDKTGNDPIKMAHFVRLQKAKELLLSGTSMELSTTNKDIMNERLLGLVQKSMGSFIVVCLWTVLSAMQLLRARGSDKSGGDGTMTMTAEAVEALGGEDNDASTNARGEHATAADGSERTAANTNDSGAAGVSSNEHATFAPDRVGGVRRRKPASKPRSGGG